MGAGGSPEEEILANNLVYHPLAIFNNNFREWAVYVTEKRQRLELQKMR